MMAFVSKCNENFDKFLGVVRNEVRVTNYSPTPFRISSATAHDSFYYFSILLTHNELSCFA